MPFSEAETKQQQKKQCGAVVLETSNACTQASEICAVRRARRSASSGRGSGTRTPPAADPMPGHSVDGPMRVRHCCSPSGSLGGHRPKPEPGRLLFRAIRRRCGSVSHSPKHRHPARAVSCCRVAQLLTAVLFFRSFVLTERSAPSLRDPK